MSGKRWPVAAAAALGVVLLLLSCLSWGGCGGKGGEAREGGEDVASPAEAEGEREGGGEQGAGGHRTVHACGRSVLAGWMEHRGWDGDPAMPARFDGFDFYYHEMDPPPGITEDAREVMKRAGGGSIVFFKLCFADFEGGDEETARANLLRNQAIVDQLVEYSRGFQGQVLLLGNALPVVGEYCDRWLVWNQQSYNRHLEELAAGNPGVWVVDLYGALAAPDGSLKARFAPDPYDSHPNAAGYAAMDEALRLSLASLGELP